MMWLSAYTDVTQNYALVLTQNYALTHALTLVLALASSDVSSHIVTARNFEHWTGQKKWMNTRPQTAMYKLLRKLLIDVALKYHRGISLRPWSGGIRCKLGDKSIIIHGNDSRHKTQAKASGLSNPTTNLNSSNTAQRSVNISLQC